MKKFLTTFILFLFLFNIFGFYIPFIVKRTVIRSEMSSRLESVIPANLIVKLSFDPGNKDDAPVWIREGKEFRYKDEMYDVLKSEISNGKRVYYCVRDKDEKELEASFDNLLKKNQANGEKSGKNIVKELSKYFPTAKTEIPSVQKKFDFNLYSPGFYKSIQKDILSPPPEIS